MIKNVVFDFGQVLVKFDPEYMTKRYIENEKDAKLVSEVIFDRLYWDRLDEGTISDDEVIIKSLERLPKRLHEDATKVYYNWIYNTPEIDGMRELIKEIKEKYNVNIYLLSNVCTYFAERHKEFSIFDNFDGFVFSGVCGLVKPHREIFEYLTDKFNINPEETVFIDDNENNVKGATAFGIKTYRFNNDADKLKLWLENELKR